MLGSSSRPKQSIVLCAGLLLLLWIGSYVTMRTAFMRYKGNNTLIVHSDFVDIPQWIQLPIAAPHHVKAAIFVNRLYAPLLKLDAAVTGNSLIFIAEPHLIPGGWHPATETP